MDEKTIKIDPYNEDKKSVNKTISMFVSLTIFTFILSFTGFSLNQEYNLLVFNKSLSSFIYTFLTMIVFLTVSIFLSAFNNKDDDKKSYHLLLIDAFTIIVIPFINGIMLSAILGLLIVSEEKNNALSFLNLTIHSTMVVTCILSGLLYAVFRESFRNNFVSPNSILLVILLLTSGFFFFVFGFFGEGFHFLYKFALYVSLFFVSIMPIFMKDIIPFLIINGNNTILNVMFVQSFLVSILLFLIYVMVNALFLFNFFH